MDVDHFSGWVAQHYDESAAETFDPAVVEPVVHRLTDLAGSGAALELGAGTGRIALPLSACGVRVHGIDLSPGMLAQLRAFDFGGAAAYGVLLIALVALAFVFGWRRVNEEPPGG